ncbi:DEAD/DEAH box helicase [Candidatus Micrarchaeota archaeon]|nr:DEAD/DEAH box helicase [Candidatus Micrarchaeota archaeon]
MLRPEVVKAAKMKGFKEFTEIQLKAIPEVLAGKNTLIIAPVGYGKTEAAVLPVFSKMLDLREKGETAGIQAIYITPLRALNRDMLSRLDFWCSELGISLSVRHGDTPQSQRRKQRDQPMQFLITTPETLCSVLVAPVLKDSLKNVRFVMIDEVHELFESKRGIQLSVALERLKEKAIPQIQIVGLSATVGNEREVASFLSRDANVVKIGFRRELQISVESPPLGKESMPFSILHFSQETVGKLQRITSAVLEHKRTLIFVNTRATAESLASRLFQVPELKEKIAVHHSSLSKEVRIETEERFKAGELKAIICTSSLELGIDIGDIDLVIQYMSPRQVTRLIQRVGRSGHRTHLIPKGIVLSSNPMDCVESVVIAEKAKKHELEPLEIQKNALDVLAHQLAGMALDYGIIELEKAFQMVRRAYPYANLQFEAFKEVAEQLAGEGLVFVRDNRLTKNSRTLLYYYENISMIPDEKKFFVKDAATRRNVGILHEGFVSEYLAEGVSFITRGKPWKVLSIEEDQIHVERTEDLGAAIPDWEGEQIPVTHEVAQEVAELFKESLELSEPDLKEKYSCNSSAIERIKEFALKQTAFFLPAPKKVFFERQGRFLLIHSFLGSRENETLSRILSLFLASELGYPVRSRSSTYSILFELDKPFSPEHFCKLLKEMPPNKLRQILEPVLHNTSLFRYKFIAVGRRFGFLRRDVDYKEVSLKRIIESQKHLPVFNEALNELYHEKLRLNEVSDFLERLGMGEIVFEVVDSLKGLSPISKDFLEFEGYSELFAPIEPTSELIETFRANLLERRVELLCTYCKKTFTRRINDFSPKIFCPYCSSNQLTLAKFKEVFEKEERRKVSGLTAEERRKYRELLRITALISSYGKRALLALETYGVGPDVGARILARMHRTDEGFYKDLLQAQKDFIRTRKYWRV